VALVLVVAFELPYVLARLCGKESIKVGSSFKFWIVGDLPDWEIIPITL
jgi:hypothetical protein